MQNTATIVALMYAATALLLSTQNGCSTTNACLHNSWSTHQEIISETKDLIKFFTYFTFFLFSNPFFHQATIEFMITYEE